MSDKTFDGSYGRYVLQRTAITVTVDDGSSSSSTSTPSSTTTPITNSNVVNVTPAGAAAAAEQADKSDKTTPSIAATCVDLRKLYDQNRVKVLNFKSAALTTAAALDAAEADPSHVDRTGLVKTLTSYAQAKDDAQKASEASEEPYQLIKTYCPATFKIAVTQKDEPDFSPGHIYALKIKPNDFYDDQLSVQTGGDGTFVSIGYTATDRTTDILSNLAKSVTTLTMTALGDPAAGISAAKAAAAMVPPCSPAVGSGASAWPKALPPSPTAAQFKQASACVRQDDSSIKVPEDIDIGHYERTFVLRGSGVKTLKWGLSFHWSCTDDVNATTPSVQDGTPTGGIFVSTPQQCLSVVGLMQKDNEDYAQDLQGADPTLKLDPKEKVLNRSVISALDSDAPQRLPVRRTSFTTRTAQYTFTSGRLTTATYNRPSPLVSAMLFPATIVGAVFGTIGGQITQRTAIKSDKADYYAAEKTMRQNKADAQAAPTTTASQ